MKVHGFKLYLALINARYNLKESRFAERKQMILIYEKILLLITLALGGDYRPQKSGGLLRPRGQWRRLSLQWLLKLLDKLPDDKLR
jgi:hypothetical protein